MDTRELAQVLREKNPEMKLNESLDQAKRMLSALDALPVESGPLFDTGVRDKGEPRPRHGPLKRGARKPTVRTTPTRKHRLNRALVELSHPAFKVHTLLWEWRGSAAKGNLPFFTLKSLGRFCGADRNVIRRAIAELSSKGWIAPGQYDCHKKNSLYRLVPIEEIRVPGVDEQEEVKEEVAAAGIR